MTDFASQHVSHVSQNFDVSTNPVARFFNRIWNGLVFLAESGSQAQALKRLSEISDAEFEARGMTRADAVRRVFAPRFYI